MDLTLGLSPHLDEVHSEQQYLINDFIYCKPGRFDHLEGFEELVTEGLLKDYYLFKWKGALLGDVTASGDRIAGYTIVADSMEDLIYKHNLVRKRIRVVSDEGKDLIRHDLLTDLYSKNGFLYSSH